MKHLSSLLTLIILAVISAAFYSCGDDESVADLTGNRIQYTLTEFGNSGLSGRVEFEERADKSTRVTVTVTGSFSQDLPIQIRNGDEIEGGEILVNLNPVSFSSSESVTEVSTTSAGTSLSYDSWSTINAHIRMNRDPLDLSSIAALAAIGNNELLDESESYAVSDVNGSGVSGNIIFTKRKDGHTLVTMEFSGTSTDVLHPAGIYSGNSDDGGTEIIELNSIDGTTGLGFTSVREDKNGTPNQFDELNVLDAHCIVSFSATNPSTVSRSDIAGNALTGEFVTYSLDSIAVPEIKGTATLQEKKSGEARLVIELENTPAGGLHPASIFPGTTIDPDGDVFVNLNPVDGDIGIGVTHIEAADDGSDDDLTYAELVEYPGHIKVSASAADAGTIVAEGDFGSKGLTGNSTTFTVIEQNGSGFSGVVIFEERFDLTTLITIILEGTSPGDLHPTHIHENSFAASGGIELSFPNRVNGTTGISKNNATRWDNNKGPNNDGADVTYDELVTYDGHVLIHIGPTGAGTPVASADIGPNAN